MGARKPSLSDRFYRSLLRLLPADFRGDFGPEMEEVFHEQHASVRRRGDRIGILRLWWETVTGIFRTAPREHFSMLHQDVRFALRMMRKNAGYSAAAILTLALGIGTNTAIFSVIDAVLLRPLPYHKGHELVVLHQEAPRIGIDDMRFSVKEIADYKSQNRSLADLVEYHSMLFTLFSGQEAQRVRAGVVSATFFDMFGVHPILGRTFFPSDDRPGADPVLLLSYEYWKQHQGGDPNIVGKKFEMNDRAHTVIGVLPPFPQYPNENDVYMPASACPYRARIVANRNGRMMSLFGRSKPGLKIADVRRDLAAIAQRLQQTYPESYNKAIGFTASSNPLHDELTRNAKPTLLVLLAAAGFVLLIACANVANLTLARMQRRERELVVRSALGAGKGRLLRQLVTESLIMGLAAAALGTVFASFSLNLLIQFTARLSPRAREIHIDTSVLLFALLAGILTSLVFGSISALYSREDLSETLKEGPPHVTMGRVRRRARNVLIVCQVAFSFVLLVGAGLMLRSFSKLQRVDPGFIPQQVLAMTVDLNWSKYNTAAKLLDVSDHLLAKVQSVPGVLSAALSSGYPLEDTGPWFRNISIEGRKDRDRETQPVASIRTATPDYFATLGIPIVQGRAFTRDDGEDAPVVVVNQALARHHWPGETAVGKRITFDGKTWITVAGVAGDVREFGLHLEPSDEVYVPHTLNPNVGSILLRTSHDPAIMAERIRRAILEIDPKTAIPNVQTLEQVRSDNLTSQRVMTNLLAIFGALALLVAATGIGGILALTVSQRMHEIGIRVALGAKPGDVFRTVIRQGMSLVAIGLAVGLIGALAFTRLLQTLLFQVTPTDPATFAAVSLLLASTALMACYVPARRATRIDPLLALRQE
jgi:predicted permease